MSEPVIGLNIRKEATSSSPKLGILPRGTRIEVGERSSNGRWAKIARIIEGDVAPVRQGDPVDPEARTGWVYLGELDPDAGEPELDKVVVLSTPRPIKAGAVVGHLGEYQRFEDAKPVPERGTRALLHVEVFSGDDVPAFVARCRSYAETLPPGSKSLMVIDRDAKLVLPRAPDTTIGGDEGLRAAAGGADAGRYVQVRRGVVQVVERATLGKYTSGTSTYEGGQIFTGWFVGASDDQRTSDEAESNRRGYSRREVMLPSGAPVWVERTALGENGQRVGTDALPAWSSFPLQVESPSGPEVPLAHVRSRAELERVDANDRAVDPEGKRWYRLDVGAAGRARVSGWVREEGQAGVSWQSPWAWPGFEFVEEGEVAPVDLFSREVWLSGRMTEILEKADFKARADKVEASALVGKIYELVDENGDGSLDPQELRRAMQQPLLARGLARIIAHYESEWGGEMSKWHELDALMLDGVEEWGAEKQRIEALRWWPEVAGGVEGFPEDPTVHHIHPIALVANFFGRTLTIEEARVRAFLRMLRIGEGTVGPAGYERLFGGKSFIRDFGRDFSDHPRILIKASGYSSTAAGAYQVMGYTWDDAGQIAYRRRYGIADFSPFSQDRYGVILVKHKRSALELVKQGKIREAIDKCNREWASLPGSPYGQPTVTYEEVLAEYEDFLEQELRGESDLVIQPGDIDDLMQ